MDLRFLLLINFNIFIMFIFFNRILYSLYCWEMVLDKVVDFLFTPFRLLLSKAIYKLNLF